MFTYILVKHMSLDAVQQVPLRHCPKPGLGGWEKKVWASWFDPCWLRINQRSVWPNVLRYSPKRNQAIHIPTNIDQGDLRVVEVVEVRCVLRSLFAATFITSLSIRGTTPACSSLELTAVMLYRW